MTPEQLQVVRKTDWSETSRGARLDFDMVLGKANPGYNIFSRRQSSHAAITVIESADINDVLVLCTYKAGKVYTATFALNLKELTWGEQGFVYRNWCEPYNAVLETVNPTVAKEAGIRLWKEEIEPYVKNLTQVRQAKAQVRQTIKEAIKAEDELIKKDLTPWIQL